MAEERQLGVVNGNDGNIYLPTDLDAQERLAAIEDNQAVIGHGYAISATAGATAAKEANITDFKLVKNATVSVYFTYGFTTTNPTLNISNTGAKPIYQYGAPLAPHRVHSHAVVTMTYDGTNWNVIAINANGETQVSGAVDLGLPSGVLWCDHNVGAATPEAPGLYFSWGNVTGHAEGSGYDFGSSNDGPYASTPGAGLSGNIAVGDAYDMARHNMGSPWRLPTTEEFLELYDNCDCEWIEQNGMPGRRFTSRANGNSVFFPAAGYYNGTTLSNRGSDGGYWSSTLYDSAGARGLSFDSSGVYPQGTNFRFYGFSVRAVQ